MRQDFAAPELLEAIMCQRCASGAPGRACCAPCSCAFARAGGSPFKCGCGARHDVPGDEVVHWRDEHWWIACAYKSATARAGSPVGMLLRRSV